MCRELGTKKSIYVTITCLISHARHCRSPPPPRPPCLCQYMGPMERGRKVSDFFDGLSIITANREIPKLFLTSIETVSWTICFFSSCQMLSFINFLLRKWDSVKTTEVFFSPSFVIDIPQNQIADVFWCICEITSDTWQSSFSFGLTFNGVSYVWSPHYSRILF